MLLPNAVMQWLGALSIFCLFLIGLVFLIQQCVFLEDRYRVPALIGAISAALIFSWFDLNDNHGIRLLADETPGINAPAPATDNIEKAFTAWLAARPDRDKYRKINKPYPVFFAAAQGGGLYAAYQAGNFLSRLQDRCPIFANHLFAMSGVSGGAVGTTTFTAMVNRLSAPPMATATECATTDDTFERVFRSISSVDFLSPLVFSMLFPDFTARFSPVPIPAFDRARALETTFEEAWPQNGNGETSGLEEGLLNYWRPDGPAPVMLINTTEVDTGRRMILSPIHDLGSDLRSYATFAQGKDGAVPNMRLSTAMILSARFPWITPAGSIQTYERLDGVARLRKARLVDGGYFENSGVETATDIIRMLGPIAKQENVEFRLIVFDLTDDAPREPSYGFGEISSPIKALLKARESRAELVRRRARREFNPSGDKDCRYIALSNGEGNDVLKGQCDHESIFKDTIWHVSLDDLQHDFQLGWLLSRDTLKRIEHQNGSVDACNLGARESRNSNTDKAVEADDNIVRRHNSCIHLFAEMLLTGETFEQ